MRKETWVITDPNSERVAEVLSRATAVNFDDNGEWPDGNAFAPRIAEKFRGDLHALEDSTGASFTENAHYFQGDDIAHMADWLGLGADYASCRAIEDDEAFKNAVIDYVTRRGWLWSHYGAYGALDETWIIIPR